MGCEIVRAELAGPPAGQRLRLVAPGEEGELGRITPANLAKPLGRQFQRLVPLDLAEFARSPLACSKQRLGQLCRSVLVHDARTTLGAQHTLVDRMIGIALDVTDRTVLQVDPDTAAAGTHVTGRGLHLVGHLRRQGDVLAHGLEGVKAHLSPTARDLFSYHEFLIQLLQGRFRDATANGPIVRRARDARSQGAARWIFRLK